MSEVAAPSLGLVGRERECEAVSSVIDAVRRGRSGSLVIRGLAGIGKSALLPGTVEYHLSKVFSKLGIASRAELIRRGAPGPTAG